MSGAVGVVDFPLFGHRAGGFSLRKKHRLSATSGTTSRTPVRSPPVQFLHQKKTSSLSNPKKSKL
jgi:hypothetical protein